MNIIKLHNHDEAWYYHLSKINWIFFVSIRYNLQTHYGTSFDSHRERKNLIWNLFQNTRKELKLPRNAIQWFASTEKNENEGYHNHILVRLRSDVPYSKQEVLKTIFKNLPEDLVEKTQINVGDILPKSFKFVYDSLGAVSYVLKTQNGDEKVTGIKNNEFYSEKFIRLCNKLKIKGGSSW